MLHSSSDVVLKTGLGLKTIFFEVLVLAKAVLVLTLDGLKDLKNCGLVLTLDGLKDLKNCGLKNKKVLQLFSDLKDLKILFWTKPNFSS